MTTRESDRDYHVRLDPHRHSSDLADVILGGQDGLVNVLGVELGVAAATGDSRVVLAAGLAAAFAESVSMAAVAYTTTMAEAACYEAERARERRHVRRVPSIERDEIRILYRRMGFDGDLLERVVAQITSDEEVWVTAMMVAEHQLSPVSRAHALRSSLVVGVAAIVGSLVPLAPFVVLPARSGSWVSAAVAVVALFALGAFKARRTVGGPLRSGLELAAIGLASALVGFAVGAAFHVPAAP